MKKRNEIAKQDCWNLETLYPSMQAWEHEFQTFIQTTTSPRFPQVSPFKGHLKEGPKRVLEALTTILDLERELSKLYTYAHLKHDEEITENENKVAYNKILSALHDFHFETSWFEPELLAFSQDDLDTLVRAKELEPYAFFLRKIIRKKKHTLNEEQEAICSLSAKPMQASHKAFSAINDADLKFGTVLDSNNKQHPLNHGSFSMYLQSQDRILRENAFKQYHNTFLSYENTLAELLAGQTEAHNFFARTHGFKNCLEASLFPKNIDVSVYHSLIEAVNQELPTLHRYFALRKKILKVDTLHLYDMYVPLTDKIDIKLSYDEAEAVVIESVAPLGAEYQNLLKQGLKEKRWVDRYQNENKRSGAYSSGCYDSQPYILMNYKELLRDVFTLAHEAGHSMHSLLSHKNQPYHTADYPIFLAEVASTFNEDLLTKLMLERAESDAEKIYLLNQKIEDIRATLFRQTLFAEFELLLHTLAENNTPITPTLLKEEYRKLNVKYFGSETVIDKEAEIEWARIPHFYYNFYVYQYATGISAALALSERVQQGGAKERDDYLSFLKGGSSQYPIELLKKAGVDMTTPKPVKQAIGKFGKLVTSLEDLLHSNLATFK